MNDVDQHKSGADSKYSARKTAFRASVCAHLSAYRHDVLHIAEDGVFHYRRKGVVKALEKGHILPHKNDPRNILQDYRTEFFASEHCKFKFHRFFHHLNSSQALCINLFFPLIAKGREDIVLHFLDIGPVAGLKACFEKQSEVEQAANNRNGGKLRRTNFDFHIEHSKGEVFFEVKYTEDGFGTAKADAEHKNKFQRIYLPLIEKSVFLTEGCRDESFFFSHYQILRNLVHLSQTSQVVFLFPSANAAVNQEASTAYQQLLTDEGRARVKIVFLEEIVSFLESEFRGGPLATYYSAFREKYIPRTIH